MCIRDSRRRLKRYDILNIGGEDKLLASLLLAPDFFSSLQQFIVQHLSLIHI